MNTSTGGKCMQDTASNSNPMFSYINPSQKIKSSYLLLVTMGIKLMYLKSKKMVLN